MLYFSRIQTKFKEITMKKTLLLSVVASTMIMAGGDIAPVEPAVEAPVAAVSAWNFNGQAVAYTQTINDQDQGSLFEGTSTYGAVGLQLGATNSNVIAGIGAGVELSAIEQDDGYSSNKTGGNAQTESAQITQAYLTYGFGDTSVKVGRQTLPKALSPLAFSEGWQMFKNTFEAALVVNSSLPNTTLVYAYVRDAVNNSVGTLDGSIDLNGDDGVHMLTAQNTSFEGVTLTGTYYNAPDAATALWGDAKFKVSNVSIALQAGEIEPEVGEETTAYGAKVASTLGGFGVSLAYSSVSDGDVSVANLLGAGVKTPLYTQSVLNQNTIKRDADTFKLAGSMKALNGKFGLAYINSDIGDMNPEKSTFMPMSNSYEAGTYQEIDVTYKSKISANTTVFAAYVWQNDDRALDTELEDQNFVRFWARYSFN